MFQLLNFLRPHHWIKNFLIFVPIIASHQFDIFTIKNTILAFISFSLIASCGYVFNDLLDVKTDKLNPYKKKRMFASGSINLTESLIVILILFSISIFFSIKINTQYILIIILYFFSSIFYSYLLKKIIILDIIVLSSFYVLRIFAGSLATDIKISLWLFSFATFFFFSLAAVKRLAELVYLVKNKKNKTAGRGYKAVDLPIINSMSLCSGYISIVVLAFYINSPEVIVLYSNPNYLWGICGVIFYWITMIILVANRGDMHHDPVIYASTDKVSYICLFLILFFLTLGIY